MISWLSGTVIHIEGNEIVLNINGVGYSVTVGPNSLSKLAIEREKQVEIPIYTSVKEDSIQLFGFPTFTAKNLFISLLKVNGVGPKVALSIVDQLNENQIYLSIQKGDATPFLSVSGVGKKTAQRILLDLQDQEWKPDNSLTNVFSEKTDANLDSENIIQDAKSALTNLGFPDKEVKKSLYKNFVPNCKLDDLIKKCLTDLSKNKF